MAGCDSSPRHTQLGMTNHIKTLVQLFGNCRMVLSYPAGQGELLRALRARGVPALSLDPDHLRATNRRAEQLVVWHADWTVIQAQAPKFDGIHVDLDQLDAAETQDFDSMIMTLASGLLPAGLMAITGTVDTRELVLNLSSEFVREYQSTHVTIIRRTSPAVTPEPGMVIGPSADRFVGCEHVFEIGTGRAHFLDALAVRDIPCSGIEPNSELAAYCRAQGHRVTTGGLPTQVHKQQAYDGIYAGNSLDALQASDLVQVLAQCQHMLRDNGIVLLRFARSAHNTVAVTDQLKRLGFKIQHAESVSGNPQDILVHAVLQTNAVRVALSPAIAPQIDTVDLRINQPLQGLYDLERFERRVNSQGGEDGVLDAIFEHIGTTNRYYVEFGCGDGVQCNTANLHKQGWQGLLMDGMAKPATEDVIIHKEWISRENINQLFAKHGVPDSFDLMSIDIDGNDYWVLDAIKYRPRVIVAEYNANLGPDASQAMPYDSDSLWDGSDYYGASLQALNKLLVRRNYKLVYCNQAGVNAFFVDARELNDSDTRSVPSIYRAPNYWYRGYRQTPDLSRSMIEV